MRIGVPKEIKTNENRVALVPAGAEALVAAGHQVFIETGAGIGSGFEDEAYTAVGATIVLCVTAHFHWVVQSQGFAGAEKSLLWGTITLFFAIRGGGFLSVDGMMRKEI